jgi:hypothetical protein
MSAAGVALFGRTLTWPRNDFHLFGGNGELAPLQISPARRSPPQPARCASRADPPTRQMLVTPLHEGEHRDE